MVGGVFLGGFAGWCDGWKMRFGGGVEIEI